VGDFFELPPPQKVAEPSEPRTPVWWQAPSGELPCPIPVSEILARNDDVVIGVGGGRAYTTGFELTFYVFAPHGTDDLEPFPFRALEEGGDPADYLRLGLEYADGSRLSNTSSRRWPGDESDGGDSPTMNFKRGQGRPREWHGDFWCWPLPPSGIVQLVCEWPQMGISLSRRALDGSLILNSAERAEKIL
jgi:hypothetical protein